MEKRGSQQTTHSNLCIQKELNKYRIYLMTFMSLWPTENEVVQSPPPTLWKPDVLTVEGKRSSDKTQRPPCPQLPWTEAG